MTEMHHSLETIICDPLKYKMVNSGPEVIKLFSYSTQLSTKFILLMTTVVGILTFICMINTSERLKVRNFFVSIIVFKSI